MVEWVPIRQDASGPFHVAAFGSEQQALAALATHKQNASGQETFRVGLWVTEGLEAVRKRPAMYYGPGGLRLEEAAFHSMCLALTEAHQGTCTAISLHVTATSLVVIDNGMGVSLNITKHGLPFAHAAMTNMWALASHRAWKLFVTGPNAVLGPALVTAASESASIEVISGGRRHFQSYTACVPDAPVASTSDDSPSGTTLVFNLDTAYLSDEPFDPQRFRDRISSFPIDLSNLALTIHVDHTAQPLRG